MKLKHAAVLTAVALLAACGGGKQDGIVQFIGYTPVTANQKDIRTFQTFCPGCKEPIAVDTARCPSKKCKTDMVWRADYRCQACQGSGVCNACTLMEQTKGECYNCKGQGVLIFAGQSPTCPNCKGNKVCPTCKGTRKCDNCVDGKVAKDVVKTKAAKFVSKDEGLPDSDPRPPAEAPKPEEKKNDAPKPEEKKEGAAEEKK